jgi:hypothetical protein
MFGLFYDVSGPCDLEARHFVSKISSEEFSILPSPSFASIKVKTSCTWRTPGPHRVQIPACVVGSHTTLTCLLPFAAIIDSTSSCECSQLILRFPAFTLARRAKARIAQIYQKPRLHLVKWQNDWCGSRHDAYIMILTQDLPGENEWSSEYVNELANIRVEICNPNLQNTNHCKQLRHNFGKFYLNACESCNIMTGFCSIADITFFVTTKEADFFNMTCRRERRPLST